MKALAIHVLLQAVPCSRCGAWIALAAAGLAASTAHAQEKQEADQRPEAPAPYRDRLIDDGNLTPALTTDELQQRNTNGNLRSLIVELGGARIVTRSQSDAFDTSALDRPQQEAGILVSGKYQTDNFGLLGLEAQLRRGSRVGTLSQTDDERWNGLLKLSTDDLPLGSGWLADSALGATSTPLIGLFDRQARFLLPVTPIMGAAITLEAYEPLAPGQPDVDPEPIASVNLSVGEPGLIGGLRLSDYSGLTGLLISGGGQIKLSEGWAAGVQAIAVDDTRDPFAAILQSAGGEDEVPRISSRAAVGSLGYARRGLRLQANMMWSTRTSSLTDVATTTQDGSAIGGSIDFSYRASRTSHSGGLYYYGPRLTWGASAVLSNAYGGYYRLSRSSQRWRWTFNIDAVESVDASGVSGVVVNADTRRKLGFSTAAGLNASLRIANGQTAGQALGYVDFESDLGSSRAEAGWSRDALADFYRIGFVQNWTLPQSMPAGSRLSTQMAYQYRKQGGSGSFGATRVQSEEADGFSIAASGGLLPFKDVSLDATVSYSSDASTVASEFFGPFQSTGTTFASLATQRTDSFSAMVVASARLSANWSLSGSYTDTRSSLLSRFGIPLTGSPLGPDPAQLEELRRSSFRLRAAYLTLRYNVSAGRPRGMLGNRQYPVGGTGNLTGSVYLDANGNGTRDPSEVGVPGIIVILDGREALRTDETGMYVFRGIADGQHRITVNADNLPLPWFIEAEDGSGRPFSATIEVQVRSTTALDIAARRY